MSGVVIFGGTTEGREWAVKLSRQGESVTVCVTGTYARSLLPAEMPCRVGAMDAAEMESFLRECAPSRVIDATHPYAVRATANIRAACRSLGIPCQRVERAADDDVWRRYVQHVPDAAAAAQALSRTAGNALLTTGSHTVGIYTSAVPPERLWVRVLPTMEALGQCAAAGVLPSRIIAMHGPFSSKLNAALYDQLGIRAMVTKDSGARGGVAEKVIPALERDIHVILIERPGEG